MQESRAPLVNWKQQIDNLLESYNLVYDLPGINPNTALAHALQKDAIQNSIDAYDSKNPVWSIIFELNISTRTNFISITDQGTYGLTGRANIDAETLSKLPFKEYENERWCRFESLGYKNPDPRARGARGQGKFIFIGSSKKKEIIYETLRSDGVYRVGCWKTELGSKPLVGPFEGDHAKRYLASRVPEIHPLDKVGTRIIILEPEEWLKRSFIPLKQCDLGKYISETWWELLLDEKFRIYLKYKQDMYRVLPPKLYKEFLENSAKFSHMYIKNQDISFGDKKFEGAKVKDLVIAYSKEEIPDELQGIAIQRNKMKIFSYDITYGNDFIDPDYKKHIFGWITFNEKAEEELKGNESSTHYGFTKPRGSLPFLLFSRDGWLSKQIRKFAMEKLGLRPREKVLERFREIENEVLSIVNSLARSLDYEKGKRPVETESRGPSTPIRIQLFPLELPRPTRRVNFGESIGITARVINDSNKELKATFEIALKGPPTDVTSEIVKNVVEDEITLLPHEHSKKYGPYYISFLKGKDIPGRYTLKCTLVGREKDTKGQIFYKLTRAIYVEVEPPAFGGIFKSLKPSEFPDRLKKHVFSVEEEEEGNVIYYNVKHPVYLRTLKLRELLEPRDKMAIDPMFDYLLKVGIIALVTEDFKGDFRLLQPQLRNKVIEFQKKDHEDIIEELLENKEKLWQELLFEKLPIP